MVYEKRQRIKDGYQVRIRCWTDLFYRGMVIQLASPENYFPVDRVLDELQTYIRITWEMYKMLGAGYHERYLRWKRVILYKLFL